MLSSPSFKGSGIAKYVPIKILVVDEASQIEIGDYLPVFANYETIRKVCFIGDDKQRETLRKHLGTNLILSTAVPPHGQEDITGLQSIFELTSLRKLALFLDTQCLFFLSHFFVGSCHYSSQIECHHKSATSYHQPFMTENCFQILFILLKTLLWLVISLMLSEAKSNSKARVGWLCLLPNLASNLLTSP